MCVIFSADVTRGFSRMDDGAVFPGKEERRRDAISRTLSSGCAAVKFFHLLDPCRDALCVSVESVGHLCKSVNTIVGKK